MPTTLFDGSPENFCSAHTIASSGLVMQMTKASGAYCFSPLPTASMTLRLMPSRSSRLMPGFPRHAGGDDDHVGAGDRLVARGTGELRIEALDRRGLGDIERLALRNTVDDVEQHDVAELLQTGQEGERAADLTRADQCDLVPRHPVSLYVKCSVRPRSVPSLLLPLGKVFKLSRLRSGAFCGFRARQVSVRSAAVPRRSPDRRPSASRRAARRCAGTRTPRCPRERGRARPGRPPR